MTDPTPTRPHLLTRAEVIAELRRERGMEGLTKTATKYQIAPQQLCDVLANRAALSKRMAAKLAYIMHVLYEKVGE